MRTRVRGGCFSRLSLDLAADARAARPLCRDVSEETSEVVLQSRPRPDARAAHARRSALRRRAQPSNKEGLEDPTLETPLNDHNLLRKMLEDVEPGWEGHVLAGNCVYAEGEGDPV